MAPTDAPMTAPRIPGAVVQDASSSASTAATSAGTSGTTAATSAAACVLTPEVTEGPYYLDLDRVRSDIIEGREGTPLDLKITVVDATGCTPIKDAALDVWHCDAGGLYSGFGRASTGGGAGRPGGSQSPTDDQTVLRGTQVTDANGLGEFRAIYPGWYRGRAVHIHMKVHEGGSVVHTGQLFFDDDLTDQVYQSGAVQLEGNARRAQRGRHHLSQRGGGVGGIGHDAERWWLHRRDHRRREARLSRRRSALPYPARATIDVADQERDHGDEVELPGECLEDGEGASQAAGGC
jgi:protocatechuate 3,4-dioxygenase beta subunit